MAPRLSKKAEKEKAEWNDFLQNTPFPSTASEADKRAAFENKKIVEKKRQTAERARRYREKRKLDQVTGKENKENTAQVESNSRRKRRRDDLMREELEDYLQSTIFEEGTSEADKTKSFYEMKEAEQKANQTERNKRYYMKKKLDAERKRVREAEQFEEEIAPQKPKRILTETIAADIEFRKRFYENEFGFACSICDRLWFSRDLRPPPAKGKDMLREEFKDEDINAFEVCETCYKWLGNEQIPPLSRSNGFKYPQYPNDLPPLDCITERLVSPRLPFMQIRRLRFLNGSKSIVGQVINVPVDINKMVRSLPRALDDDQSFNVHIKRHLIHKSSYLQGYVNKGNVKKWLQYLLNKPLYKLYDIKIDDRFFEQPCIAPVIPQEKQTEEGEDEPLIESIVEHPENAQELLLAQQKTLMWSEEKYLSIAPGMNQKPENIIFDEHAEELSFPSIYLGEARTFKIPVTHFMIATSEIRRRDRRGVKPEHILYMAMKIMRVRLNEGLRLTFKCTGDTAKLTRADLEDKRFVENCIENNLSFLKSIPNSIQYWMGRKKDVFAMMRQLGKPTVFLTMSASEYNWPHLLKLLYKLKNDGVEFAGDDPVAELSSLQRTILVNEDPVTCCLYFNKLVDTIMYLLGSRKYSPFGRYRIVDYFKRIEFQQRGSPHAHILLWLENDPKETVGEKMPRTVNLIDELCSVDPEKLELVRNQTHKHTFTCYKRAKDENDKRCRFGAPFWPMRNTCVLLPMVKDDGRQEGLKKKYELMKKSLEFEDFSTIDEFLMHHNVHSNEHYLNIIRAGISRPMVFMKRTIQQKWMNNFNPWVAKVLNSNMDIQFILEEYSCAMYVVEYVNKTNRGMSTLQRDLIKLRDEYPDKDYMELMKEVSLKMLNAVEMSSQEAAWYLLQLGMSQSSRKVEMIPTVWPHERHKTRKTKAQMDKEELAGDSMDVWKEDIFQKYQKRPRHMESVSLAQFVAKYYITREGSYKMRAIPKVIRYRNYEMTELTEYKREMVTLHVPFFNEEVDLLDCNKFLEIYDKGEALILEARKEFESNIDIEKTMEYCRKLMNEDNNVNDGEAIEKQQEFVKSKATTDDFVQSMRDGNDDDIRMGLMENMSYVVRKRENVMTSQQYNEAMRRTNKEQRDLILEAIHRMYSNDSKPLQIFFTGPAGCGKTFTMRLLMETYNRKTQKHNSAFNAYVSCASTGMAAAAINGTTVHSAFRISNSRQEIGLSIEALNQFRAAFNNVAIIFVDECSMIGSFMLKQINTRLQRILHVYDKPFGGMNIVLCGDLRQLPPVMQTPIYKRSKSTLCDEILWQTLDYYPLVQVMRQSDVTFSGILTKIGDGTSLTPEEKAIIESRFVTHEYVGENYPEAIRLFFRTMDVAEYNSKAIQGEEVIEHLAIDAYSGHRNNDQLVSARTKVHKMKTEETGGLPFMLKLLIGKPYMIRANIDVIDGLVNGAIGVLRYVEFDVNPDDGIKRLWLSFADQKIGRLVRTKCKAHVASNANLHKSWVPIGKRTATITLNSKIVSCKRNQFPLVEACAITIHKSQGGTYDSVIYEYDKAHEQQLVYVALSRATSLEGLYLTNKNSDHTFHHARGKANIELKGEFQRLENHKLDTIGERSRRYIGQVAPNPTALSLLTFNVQSLKAHVLDIETDSVLPTVKIMSLSETWVENEERGDITGFKPVSQFKRKKVRAGGVSIYEKEDSDLNAIDHDLLKYDEPTKQIKRMATSHDDVGDICAAQMELNGQKVLLVNVYISPNTNIKAIRRFFVLNLMAYSPKIAGIFEDIDIDGFDKIPIILGGDVNVDLKSENGENLREFLNDNWGLQLNNDPAISTTSSNTCIDGVFTRNLDNLQTQNYISYFSYHKPLLSITVTNETIVQ